jgi:hypothetical protein
MDFLIVLLNLKVQLLAAAHMTNASLPNQFHARVVEDVKHNDVNILFGKLLHLGVKLEHPVRSPHLKHELRIHGALKRVHLQQEKVSSRFRTATKKNKRAALLTR